MRRLLKWMADIWNQLVTYMTHSRQPASKSSGIDSTQTTVTSASTNETSKPSVPTFNVNDNNYDNLFDAIMNDIDRQKRRTFSYRARPVGFKGADVVFEAAKKWRRGTRIIRSNGMMYEVFGIKKTKRSCVGSSTFAAAGGQ